VRAKYVHQVLKLSVQIPHDRERRASGDGELDHVWHLAESRGLAAHELLGHRTRHDSAAAECVDELEESGLVDRRREAGGAANAAGHHIRQVHP
jgi:hypothetical protein